MNEIEQRTKSCSPECKHPICVKLKKTEREKRIKCIIDILKEMVELKNHTIINELDSLLKS